MFLGVLLDKNSARKLHIKYIENKIEKHIGLLFKAKPFLNKESILSLYYLYIHSNVNHANVAWASTYMTNFKKKAINKNMLFVSFLIKESLSLQDLCLNQRKFYMFINYTSLIISYLY